MKITADTNVLLRAIVGDDAEQGAIAQAELANAELIALPAPALCELVWVLAHGYGYARSEISSAIQGLLAAENVVFDRPTVEAGLAHLASGGDFADGVIAFEGHGLGAEVFVSFDRAAVRRVKAEGGAARQLG